MAAEGGAGAAVIGLHVVPGAGQRQRHARFSSGAGLVEQRQAVFHAGDVPPRTMAMATEPTQRTGIGQQALLAAIQCGALAQVADILERAPRTFAHDGLYSRFIAAVDQAQAEPDRGRAPAEIQVQSQSL